MGIVLTLYGCVCYQCIYWRRCRVTKYLKNRITSKLSNIIKKNCHLSITQRFILTFVFSALTLFELTTHVYACVDIPDRCNTLTYYTECTLNNKMKIWDMNIMIIIYQTMTMKDLRNDKPNHDSFINKIEGHCLKCVSWNKRKDKYARYHPVLWGDLLQCICYRTM